MYLTLWRRAFALLFAWSALAVAQTAWPDFMSRLSPSSSVSPVDAVLPANVIVEPPTPDVPPDKARWSGKWSGWACQDRVCSTKLVVEKVTADAAGIIYAFASADAKPPPERVEAKFVGDELQATLRSDAKLAYRMRIDGNLEFLFRRGNQWAAGILSRD